jgi:hypothetical protein
VDQREKLFFRSISERHQLNRFFLKISSLAFQLEKAIQIDGSDAMKSIVESARRCSSYKLENTNQLVSYRKIKFLI